MIAEFLFDFYKASFDDQRLFTHFCEWSEGDAPEPMIKAFLEDLRQGLHRIRGDQAQMFRGDPIWPENIVRWVATMHFCGEAVSVYCCWGCGSEILAGRQ